MAVLGLDLKGSFKFRGRWGDTTEGNSGYSISQPCTERIDLILYILD